MSDRKKVWFITGSNSGFGRYLTEAVLAKGDKVVATTRTEFAGDSLATPDNPIDDYEETAHKFVKMQS